MPELPSVSAALGDRIFSSRSDSPMLAHPLSSRARARAKDVAKRAIERKLFIGFSKKTRNKPCNFSCIRHMNCRQFQFGPFKAGADEYLRYKRSDVHNEVTR